MLSRRATLEADYITVVEDRPVRFSADGRTDSSILAKTDPQQLHSLFAMAKLLDTIQVVQHCWAISATAELLLLSTNADYSCFQSQCVCLKVLM